MDSTVRIVPVKTSSIPLRPTRTRRLVWETTPSKISTWRLERSTSKPRLMDTPTPIVPSTPQATTEGASNSDFRRGTEIFLIVGLSLLIVVVWLLAVQLWLLQRRPERLWPRNSRPMERETTLVTGGPGRYIERRRDHSRNQDDKINPVGNTYWPSQQPRGPRASQSRNTTNTADPREATTKLISRGRDMTGTGNYAERTSGESQNQGRVGSRASIEQQWRTSIPLPIRPPTTRDHQDTSFPPHETAQPILQAPGTTEASGYGRRSRPVTQPQDQIKEWRSREEHIVGTVAVPEQAHTRLDISASSREAARDAVGRSTYSRRSQPESRPQAQDREQMSMDRARNTRNRSSYSGRSQPEPRPQVQIREQLPRERHVGSPAEPDHAGALRDPSLSPHETVPAILQGSNTTETSRYSRRSQVESRPQKLDSREQAQTERLSAPEQTHSRGTSASSYVTVPSVLQAHDKTETRNSRRSRPESPDRRSIIDEALAELEARDARSVQEQAPTTRTCQDTSASPGEPNQPIPRGIGRYEGPQDSWPQQQTRDPEEIELMSLPRHGSGSNNLHVSGTPGLTSGSSPVSPIPSEPPTSSPTQTAQQVQGYKPRTDSLRTARRPRSRVVSQSSSQPQSQAHGPAGHTPAIPRGHEGLSSTRPQSQAGCEISSEEQPQAHEEAEQTPSTPTGQGSPVSQLILSSIPSTVESLTALSITQHLK